MNGRTTACLWCGLWHCECGWQPRSASSCFLVQPWKWPQVKATPRGLWSLATLPWLPASPPPSRQSSASHLQAVSSCIIFFLILKNKCGCSNHGSPLCTQVCFGKIPPVCLSGSRCHCRAVDSQGTSDRGTGFPTQVGSSGFSMSGTHRGWTKSKASPTLLRRRGVVG